jgi:hypothetical protein
MMSAFEIAAVFKLTLSVIAVHCKGLYKGWHLIIFNHLQVAYEGNV